MTTTVETGTRQPNILAEKIDSRIAKSGHHVSHSTASAIMSERDFVFLEVLITPLIAKGLLSPLADDLPTDPEERAKIILVKGPENRMMRLTVFPRDTRMKIPVWRVSFEGENSSITLTKGDNKPTNVVSTEEIQKSLVELIEESQPIGRDLNYHLAALMAEIDPKKHKYIGWSGTVTEFMDSGLGWSAKDVEEIVKAARLAWDTHLGVRRQSGEPYFDHPFWGAMNLFRLGLATPKRIKMNLLHDVPEEGKEFVQPDIDPVTGKAPESHDDWAERITRLFSLEVDYEAAKGSVMLAKPKPDGIRIFTPEQARNEYYGNIESDEDNIIVKVLGDRWHNVMTLWAMPKDKRRETIMETRETYIPLAQRLVEKYPQVRLAINEMEREMAAIEEFDNSSV